MRVVCSFIQNHVSRLLFRQSSSFAKNSPRIKVLSVNDSINIHLTYSDFSIKVERPKNESVEVLLSRIKLKAELQHKKQVIKQYYSASNEITEKSLAKEVDVCLMQNDTVLDVNIPNSEAWPQASTLTIGNIVYEVTYNPPTVKSLNLPYFIVSGCPIRPHFIFECASVNDSTFKWYRSVTKDYANKLMNDKSIEVLADDEKYWMKIHDGYVYFTSVEDIGCFLKVVCTPKQNDRAGPDCSTESQTVVEAAPKMFPFEERQEYTKSLCDENSIRCLSYNILAKMYVEEEKYPYTSAKARDSYYRRQILLKELIGYNSDILCLQEVEDRLFERDIEPVLNQKGYTGFYARKGGRRFEGVATFFLASKFRCKRNYAVLLNKVIQEKHIFMGLLTKVAGNNKDMNKLLSQNTVLQVLFLEHSGLPGCELIVANTHLYSNKDNPEVRLIQAAVCAYFIEFIIQKKNLQSAGVLFCGDFNSLPNSPTYDFLMSGSYECGSGWKSNSNADIDTVLQHCLHLDSACGTPQYTNYTSEFTGCLDYIFYSKEKLKVTDVVPMPRHEHVIAQVGLPSEYFPSDHIALICTLQRKNL